MSTFVDRTLACSGSGVFYLHQIFQYMCTIYLFTIVTKALEIIPIHPYNQKKNRQKKSNCLSVPNETGHNIHPEIDL